MRDFRLPNVLTRHGIEGDYVVVDMEYAGPDCTEWSLDPLDKWDANTLNQVSIHVAICHQSSCRPCCMHPFNVNHHPSLWVDNRNAIFA